MKKLLLTLLFLPLTAQAQTPQYGVAMHGDLKYGPDFTHLEYTNPDAPKGGTLRLHSIGTFDSLNPFVIRGTPAAGMTFLGQAMIYDSLMEQAYDEPFSMYGLLAETIEMAPDNSWVAFNLRKEAKWQDGQPVTPEDVIWTFETLLEHGTPFFKAYYGDVTKVVKTSARRVQFNFGHNDNAELPLIIAQLPVLPKHFWTSEGREFTGSSLTRPMGSGPYKIGRVDAGRSIEYVRDPDYWGKDIPVNKGKFNFDRIIYDYYKDQNVALEAFLAGEYDYRIENTAKLWATAYVGRPFNEGRIVKEEVEHGRPAGMQGFIYNLRRPVFADINVRKALDYAFDFEWSNKQFAYGTYKRTNSYFENSELAAPDHPPQGRVKQILEQYRGKIPDEIFTTRYQAPKTDGDGNVRDNLREAMRLLDDAGYKLGRDGIRVHETTGRRLSFEIVDSSPLFERWVLPFIRNLRRIGVEATFRSLDSAQYQNRMSDFDFDMTPIPIGQSSSPGNEQRDFWSTAKADMKGSRNYIGIKDPVIDDVIEKLIRARSREELVAYTQALDYLLLSGHYLIPNWHTNKFHMAYNAKLAHPETLSPLTPAVADTWWVKQ